MSLGLDSVPSKIVVEAVLSDSRRWVFELVRVKAPIVFDRLYNRIPRRSRVYVERWERWIPLWLKLPPERERTRFSRGDVVYRASTNSLHFILRDGAGRPGTCIGRVLEGLEVLDALEKSATVALRVIG
ncbi:hypothetical protein DRN94_001415 [archaeon]|nr:hypothetical protein [archaeon]